MRADSFALIRKSLKWTIIVQVPRVKMGHRKMENGSFPRRIRTSILPNTYRKKERSRLFRKIDFTYTFVHLSPAQQGIL